LHVDSHRDAVSMIERITRDEGIECGFTRVPSYWISRKPKSEQKGQPDEEVMQEYQNMLEAGIKDVTIVNKTPYGADDGACLKIPGQGQFHAVAYCYGLAEKILANGGQIYTKTKVSDKQAGKDTFVKTQNGNVVSCKNIVMATNAPLEYIATVGKLDPNRTYIVGGLVPRGKYEWCIFQDDSMLHHKPYKYGRFYKHSETHDQLLVGGEDHTVGFEFNFEEKYSNLEKWTKERYPDINFNYRWSGQVQEPDDLIAYIGLSPGADNIYVITGDSGLGLTHGTIGGKLVSDQILGIYNPWEELYSPKRFKLKALPDLIKHLTEVQLRYTDYFRGGDVTDIEDIVPGNGAIICKGIHNYAVFKDEKGNVTACTAVCPHMKGRVRWNSNEKSWDCPIHGSRFDPYGKPINGPAKSNLDLVDINKVKK